MQLLNASNMQDRYLFFTTGMACSTPSTARQPVHVQGDDCMAEEVGVGFTDVGSGIPGTDSSQFDSATFQGWGAGFYARLAAHMAAASESIGY